MDLIAHHALTLDFWQDQVSYEGHTLPTGTISCDALNIPKEAIEKLNALCLPLNQFMGMLQLGQGSSELLTGAGKSALQIVELLRKIAPFDRMDSSYYREKIEETFSEAYLKNAMEYTASLTGGGLAALVDEKYQKAFTLLRVLPVLAHLGYSLSAFKKEMTGFAERLHECDRTPDGYAAEFGRYFAATPTLSEDNPAWMSLTNISVQYVSAVMPGKNTAQLVKRMHYVSFVGMFRSELFEGLCVGHAPRKCPICGRWFLTTDARHTKYCGGLAPGDKRGRTCRQLGNLQGRAHRELADDHPLKAVYNRRMNTILQSVRRGKLSENIATTMKKLAKDTMLRAISDPAYAASCYEQEMTQEALLSEANK